jgi:hypothetical protein
MPASLRRNGGSASSASRRPSNGHARSPRTILPGARFLPRPGRPTPRSCGSPGWGSTWTVTRAKRSPVVPIKPPTDWCWGKLGACASKGAINWTRVIGKKASVGIRRCGDRVEWAGLVLPALIKQRDPVIAHGLARPVKYVRLVRRKLGLRHRFYAQLVCEGTPYRKPQRQPPNRRGRLGPRSIHQRAGGGPAGAVLATFVINSENEIFKRKNFGNSSGGVASAATIRS